MCCLLRLPFFVPTQILSGKRPTTNQGETKERPKNSEIQKRLFIKIAVSFTSLIHCLIPPRELRQTTERRAKRYRALAAKNSALFLRLLSKKVVSIPKKVDSHPKKVDSFPETIYLSVLNKNRTKKRFVLLNPK